MTLVIDDGVITEYALSIIAINVKSVIDRDEWDEDNINIYTKYENEVIEIGS